MRTWTIKRNGKTWIGNMLFDESMTFSDGDKVWTQKMFFRKKDAKKYLETFEHKEYFEVIGMTMDKC